MNSSTKITLKSQTGRGSKYSLQKLNLVYQIGLKLALINGYDEEFRIRNKKGDIVPNSNLLDLIHNSMTVNKNLAGMDEYIELLAETNANPEWFVNQIVKSSLKSLLANKSREPLLPQELPRKPEPSPEPISDPMTIDDQPSVINPITTGAYWGPEKAEEKRRGLATYRSPPSKRAPISYTPPSSPPSPYLKDKPPMFPARPRLAPISRLNRQEPPSLDRMDVPPSSPPQQMPKLKRMRVVDDDEVEESTVAKRLKPFDFKDGVNKSMQWDLPDEDEDFD